MPAKFEQQIADLCQLFKHMVLIDGTSRAFDRLLAARQHDRRLLIIFPQAPCNNARQRFMAFRQKDHQHQPERTLLGRLELMTPDVPDAPETGKHGNQGRQRMPPRKGHAFLPVPDMSRSGAPSRAFSGDLRQMTRQARKAPMQMAISATLKAGQCQSPQ